jgi:hypothetical protein
MARPSAPVVYVVHRPPGVRQVEQSGKPLRFCDVFFVTSAGFVLKLKEEVEDLLGE